ncbi:MAG: ankyrin repeat domain-containing protein, partial [Saprospiraceae bacterium]|nr:ankyrin repeat domain-containing protein [Saprospiraceae bacterium]
MYKTIISLAFCLFHMHVQGQNMFRTACNGNLERLDSLLENTSINTKDERGRSLLHWAVACRKKEIFDYLIKRRININTPDNQAQTPMHVAVRFNNEEYLSYLIDVQPDTAWPSIFGASLLERAVFNKNVSMIKTLVTYGVIINAVNKRGSAALEIAKRIGARD